MDFSTQIKAARTRAGLSQSQAAEAWGVPKRSLQEWEQGASKPNAENLLKLLPQLSPPSSKTIPARRARGSGR